MDEAWSHDSHDHLVRDSRVGQYVAPEVLLGKGGGHAAMDWWAMGILLYEMLFGTKPFLSTTVQDFFDNIANSKLHINFVTLWMSNDVLFYHLELARLVKKKGSGNYGTPSLRMCIN